MSRGRVSFVKVNRLVKRVVGSELRKVQSVSFQEDDGRMFFEKVLTFGNSE